jgi:subtilisin family serine protease
MHKKRIRNTVYYYTSIRENGRIKTIYLGRTEAEAREKERELKKPEENFLSGKRLMALFFIIAVIGTSLFLLRGMYVGYVTFGGPETYSPGEKLKGEINLTFMGEELYPKDSVVEIAVGNQSTRMSLAEFLSRSEGQIDAGTGLFYVSGSDLTGEGEGFGLTGEKKVYPELNFSYYLTCYSGGEKYEMIIEGACSYTAPYTYAVPENLAGCSAELVPQSVYLRGDVVDDNLVNIRLENNAVIAETGYSETLTGMGKDFAGGEERVVAFPFEKVDLSAPEEPGEYTLEIRIIYNEKILKATTKKIAVSPLPSAEELNITLPEVCEDADGDGYDTCKQPVDCDDGNSNVNPKAKEICGNLIDENCNGFDEPCTKLEDIISSKKVIFVKDEVTKEIERRNQARIIIKLKDVSKKADIENEVTMNKEVKNFVAASVSELEMINLVNKFSENEIELIQIDHPIRLVLEDVINQTDVNMAWDANATGKGQTVCVVDSGIDYNHPSLSGNYIGGYDFINGDSDPMDDLGHGTYVSGIVAGIAPDAKIVAVKVFGTDGVGYESDILAGIDYCISNKDAYNISVMLMSFGGGIFNTSCYCDSNLVANEANFAVNQGIFAVAASGNDGQPYLKAPACGSNVTSVGAVDKSDNVADFTNIEPLLDLLAPGVEVTSSKLGGGFETKNGTSISAAVVAGIAPLILENESLAPLDLQTRLKSTGVVVTQNGAGYARVDAYASLLNKITNTPSSQDGTQCEGTWEEYEPLGTLCTDWEGNCDNYCYCWGCATEGNSISCDLCDCTADCDTGCGAECDSGTNCELKCDSSTNRHTYCDDSSCSACQCDGSQDCRLYCPSGTAEYTECTDSSGCTGSKDCQDECYSTYYRKESCSGGSGCLSSGGTDCRTLCASGTAEYETCSEGSGCTGSKDCQDECYSTYYRKESCSGGSGCLSSGGTDCRTLCYDSCQEYDSCLDNTGCYGTSDCGYYTCSGGTGCTSTCATACGAPCDSNDDCGEGGQGTCNTGTCECSRMTNCATYKCFSIKNSVGTTKAIIDSAGNMDLVGTLSANQAGPCSPPAGSFIVKDSGGNCRAYIDSSGNMWLDGSVSAEQSGPCTAPASSFVIKNSAGQCKAYIDSSGNLWLDGEYKTGASI